MPSWQPLVPADGPGDVAHFWRADEDGGGEILSVQDVAPILDRNKAMATHNDGYSPSRDLRRVAFIPNIIRDKWLKEEGWDAYRPDLYGDKLKAKLNDADFLYLRTAPGRF